MPEIRYSDLYSLLDSGKVDSVTLKGLQISGKLKSADKVDGQSITTLSLPTAGSRTRALLPLLRDKGVAVTVKSEEQPSAIVRISHGHSSLGAHLGSMGLDVAPGRGRDGGRPDGTDARRPAVPRGSGSCGCK